MKLFLIFMLLQIYDNSFETWDYPTEFITSDWSVTAVVKPQPVTECKCLRCICDWEGECIAGCGNAAKTARIINGYDYIEYVDLDECLNEWEYRHVYVPRLLDKLIKVCTNDYRNANLSEIIMLMREFDAAYYFAYQRDIKYDGYVYSWWEREECL